MGHASSSRKRATDSSGRRYFRRPTEGFHLFNLPNPALRLVASLMPPADVVAYAMMLPKYQKLIGSFQIIKVSQFTWRISDAYPKFSYIELKFEKDSKPLLIYPPYYGDLSYDFEALPPTTADFSFYQNPKENKKILLPSIKVRDEKASLQCIQKYSLTLRRFLRVVNFKVKIRNVMENFDFLDLFVWKCTRGASLEIDSHYGIPIEHIFNMECWKLKVFLVCMKPFHMHEFIKKWWRGGFAALEYLELNTGHVKLENRGVMVSKEFERNLKLRRATMTIHNCTFRFTVRQLVE